MMKTLAAILLLSLTRAELIERFRTPPVTQVEGLVQVYADCPSDMRREYQLPIAGFVSGVCRRLYSAQSMKPVRFAEPGIVVHIGGVRTNVSAVVVTTDVRSDGSRFMRIKIPAPGFTDTGALRIAAARGFFLAVKGEEIDDAGAVAALRAADPALRVADERAELARWREHGEYSAGRDDEYYLKQLRKVMAPGSASREDVIIFASRLVLYPPFHAFPFCGRYESCSLGEAIVLSRKDPVVRLMAIRKATELLVFGGGRGDAMTAAAQAYAAFLTEVARGEKTDGELRAMLASAEMNLKGVADK